MEKNNLTVKLIKDQNRHALIKELMRVIDPDTWKVFDDGLTGTLNMELHVRQGGIGKAYFTFRKEVL